MAKLLVGILAFIYNILKGKLTISNYIWANEILGQLSCPLVFGVKNTFVVANGQSYWSVLICPAMIND